MEGRGPEVLVSGARTGDEAAWTRLYDLHAGRLLLWLQLPLTDAASTADDIAAQSWLTAASKIGEFRGSDDDFGGWLFGIARGHALNHYRKGVRRRTRPGDVDEAAESLFGGPLDDVGRADDRDSVRRLLAHLSPREAEVIACVDVVGLDMRTTAAALGMKPTAVRVARHRGLNRLRKLWDEREDRRGAPGQSGQPPG